MMDMLTKAVRKAGEFVRISGIDMGPDVSGIDTGPDVNPYLISGRNLDRELSQMQSALGDARVVVDDLYKRLSQALAEEKKQTVRADQMTELLAFLLKQLTLEDLRRLSIAPDSLQDDSQIEGKMIGEIAQCLAAKLETFKRADARLRKTEQQSNTIQLEPEEMPLVMEWQSVGYSHQMIMQLLHDHRRRKMKNFP